MHSSPGWRIITSIAFHRLFYSSVLIIIRNASNVASNRLMKCKIKVCKSVMWAYNIGKHYEAKHGEEPAPNMVEKSESDYLKKNEY